MNQPPRDFRCWPAWPSCCSARCSSSAGRTAVLARYGRGDTTPIEVTVGPQGGTFDLELTDE